MSKPDRPVSVDAAWDVFVKHVESCRKCVPPRQCPAARKIADQTIKYLMAKLAPGFGRPSRWKA